MKLFKACFIFLKKKESTLTCIKPKKKPKRSRKEHKGVQGKMDQSIVGNEELFLWGTIFFDMKINLLLVDKGLVWSHLNFCVIFVPESRTVKMKYLL